MLPTHRVLTTPVPRPRNCCAGSSRSLKSRRFPFQPSNEPQVRGQFIETLRSRGQSVPMFGLALQNDAQYYLLT